MTDWVAWATGELRAAGVESARTEAQLLLMLLLGVPRSSVIASTHPPLTPEQQARFTALVQQRAARVPLAYLRGTQEFYGLDFVVSPDTLIPRPETEMLVDVLREAATEREAFLFGDVGTGSGCIPIAALVHLPAARAMAFDISSAALMIAEENAARHTVSSRIAFVQGDLLAGVEPDTFHWIVSNPPYIATSDIANLQPEVRDGEPHLALDGGADGLDLYRRLIPQAYTVLKPGGGLAVEIGQGQHTEVAALFKRAGFHTVQTRTDLAGIVRVVSGGKGHTPGVIPNKNL